MLNALILLGLKLKQKLKNNKLPLLLPLNMETLLPLQILIVLFATDPPNVHNARIISTWPVMLKETLTISLLLEVPVCADNVMKTVFAVMPPTNVNLAWVKPIPCISIPLTKNVKLANLISPLKNLLDVRLADIMLTRNLFA